MSTRTFEVLGLLRLKDDTQHKTTDTVRADSPAHAVRAIRNLRRVKNGPQFVDWLHVLTRSGRD